jgi:hypothetical protein
MGVFDKHGRPRELRHRSEIRRDTVPYRLVGSPQRRDVRRRKADAVAQMQESLRKHHWALADSRQRAAHDRRPNKMSEAVAVQR